MSFSYPASSDEEPNLGVMAPAQSTRTQREITELNEALKKSQLENGQLRAIIQQLKDENATLKAKASKGRGRKAKGEDLSESEQVKRLGKQWSLMVAPWVHQSYFKQPCPNINATDKEYFRTDEANRLRAIQELYNFVPSTFHTHLEQRNGFALDFKSGVDAQRSTSLNRAREVIAIALKEFKLTADVLQISYDRSQHPDIQKLVKFDPTKKKYPRYPPIFFPGLERDLNFILRNPVLPKFARGLLFGPKSLDENASNSAKGVINGTIGRLWQVTKVTPGFMSIAPTYMRFVLSPDKEFTAIGATSGIEYEKDFNDLKRFLVTEADSGTVKGIIKFWDQIVFSGITSSVPVGDEGDEEDDDDDFEDLAIAVRELDLRRDNPTAGPVGQPASFGMIAARIDLDEQPVIAVAATTAASTTAGETPADAPERLVRTRRAVAQVTANQPTNGDGEVDLDTGGSGGGSGSRGKGAGRGRGRGRGKGKGKAKAVVDNSE